LLASTGFLTINLYSNIVFTDMSETGESPQPINNSNGPERSKALNREEISAIRTEDKIGGRIVKSYTIPEGTVTTTFLSPNFDKLPTDKTEEILLFLRSRQNGEGYRYETLIVNSLLRQFEIGKKFGLSRDSLYTDFKLNVEDKGMILADHEGSLYLRVLDEHVSILRQQGATEEQLTTELAGHIFHESAHNAEGNMSEVLFNGRSPFGEIATVTTQMAYYLDEMYTGPTAYDPRRFKAGFNKIQNGGNNSCDYDIATYIGGKLIFQSLREAYPTMFVEVEDMDPITACQTIVAKLSPDERQKLIPTLKKAIANSADEKVFEAVLEQTKQEKLNVTIPLKQAADSSDQLVTK